MRNFTYLAQGRKIFGFQGGEVGPPCALTEYPGAEKVLQMLNENFDLKLDLKPGGGG